MLYSALIDQFRSQVGDTKRSKHVDFTADGSATVFQMPVESFPVYDDTTTYFVKDNGTLKTETTHYTLDKSTGTLIFLSAPTAGHTITVDCYAVHLLNTDWIAIINNTIRSLGDDFFKEFTDTSNFTTTANMLSLSLVASQPNCIAVNSFNYRQNSNEDWIGVEDFTNWRYDRDNNIIYIGTRDAFSATGEPLRIRGLKTYTLGSLVSDTIDVQDKYLTVIEYGSISKYWQWRYKDVVELVSKMTQENTRTPLQELIMLADRFNRQYETEKAKLKPMKPAWAIPRRLTKGGNA